MGAPSDTAEKVKVKVRVRLDMNGCFAVSSASMVETLPPSPVENGDVMETQEVNPPEKTNGEEKMEEAASSQDESVGDPMEQTDDAAKTSEEQKPDDADK